MEEIMDLFVCSILLARFSSEISITADSTHSCNRILQRLNSKTHGGFKSQIDIPSNSYLFRIYISRNNSFPKRFHIRWSTMENLQGI